jgi:hypothetical protein
MTRAASARTRKHHGAISQYAWALRPRLCGLNCPFVPHSFLAAEIIHAATVCSVELVIPYRLLLRRDCCGRAMRVIHKTRKSHLADQGGKTMRHFRRWMPLLLVVGAVIMGVTAWAEDDPLPDRFMLRLGGYQVRDTTTIVRLDANDLPVGTYIDFHETLGGDTTATLFRMDGLYRFNERHGLGFSWYSLNLSGSKVLEKDFNWNGQDYNIGWTVDSEINFDVYKLNYEYSLFHNDEVELGASFGFHIMKTMVSIVTVTGGTESASEAVTAPLPVFGLYADYHFTPRFSAYYNYQFFFVNYEDKVKGGLQDFILGLEYRLFRNIALGVAYNRFALHLEARGDTSTLYLDTGWNGGMLYGTVYF